MASAVPYKPFIFLSCLAGISPRGICFSDLIYSLFGIASAGMQKLWNSQAHSRAAAALVLAPGVSPG